MQAMTLDAVQAAAPAAFARNHGMSKHYVQLETDRVLERLMGAGYVPTGASQDKPRRRDPLAVTHLITLRREQDLKQRRGAEVIPQLLLINSHNGRSAMHMRAGIFRFVCANGLVVGTTSAAEKIRHSRDAVGESERAAEELIERAELQDARMAVWKDIEMSRAAQQRFARSAVELRWGDAGEAYDTDVLLECNRPEDAGMDLWRTFNRLQETMTQGSVQGTSANGRAVRSRPLTSINNGVKFNTELWRLAESFAGAAEAVA